MSSTPSNPETTENIDEIRAELASPEGAFQTLKKATAPATPKPCLGLPPDWFPLLR